MISKYKYILLDVDGVVLSSINYYLDLFRNVAESLGASKSIPNAFYKKNIGVKIITWMTNIVPEENHNKIKELFIAKNRDTVENYQFPIIEGTKETLLKIKENNQKPCFISSKTRESMDSVIKYYKLDSIIDFSISGDEVKNFKPDPEGIFSLMERFQVKAQTATFGVEQSVEHAKASAEDLLCYHQSQYVRQLLQFAPECLSSLRGKKTRATQQIIA